MKSAVILEDLYNVLQTLVFVSLCVTLVWDALFWVSGYSHLWMQSGFHMPLAALAMNLLLCALYIATTLGARLARRTRGDSPECQAEPARLPRTDSAHLGTRAHQGGQPPSEPLRRFPA